MAKLSPKKNIPALKSHDDVHKWIQNVDLTEYIDPNEFYKMRFARLEKKLIDESYEKSLKSQPVTLRLPQELIQQLKLAAIKQGIAYQTLARLLLQKNVKKLLSV